MNDIAIFGLSSCGGTIALKLSSASVVFQYTFAGNEIALKRFDFKNRRSIVLRVPIRLVAAGIDGARPYFECPGLTAIGCARVVQRLYMLAPNSALACRRCWNLTYYTERTHDPRVSRLAKASIDDIRRHLFFGTSAQRRVAREAVRLRLERAQ